MKINPNFPYDLFKFIHKPIRDEDKENDDFLQRYLYGMQAVWEMLDQKIKDIQNINNPAKCRADLLEYLKDIVGLTRDLGNITDSLTEEDLRKIILLAVPLWKKKGIEVGFKDIVKLFTGFNSRVFNWFDYRMIVGEKAIGEEQLGEDSWLISRPGVEGYTPEMDVILLLQFNDYDIIKDGSINRNTVVPYGDHSWEVGGPFSNSPLFLRGVDFYLQVLNSHTCKLEENISIEMFFQTTKEQNIPLFHKYDSELNKGIRIYADTVNDEITYMLSDGTNTQTHTASAGTDLDNGGWKHLALVIDWDEDDDGKIAIWLNGSRIIFEDMSGALIKQGLNTEKDLFICEESLSGDGYTIGLDGIRVISGTRYSVLLSTITPPATNYIEYQEEQLDEFQIDIRVVDNGSLDRPLLKRILNLMRGSSERINILYIDFYDAFESGKGQYKTVTGTGYVEEVDNVYYMKLPPNSVEIAEVLGSTEWTNYLVQHRCLIYSGSQVEIRFCYQDDLNFYAFRINAELKMAYFEKVVAGTRTDLATPKEIDVEAGTPPIYLPYYVFMVSCFKNENTGETTLRGYIDSNLIFSADDNNFSKGSFGIHTPTDSTVWCSESEMFQMPLEYDRINPNSEF